jgi:hypothetical protein
VRKFSKVIVAATILFVAFVAFEVCAQEGVRPLKRYGVAYEGPEVEAAVRFYQAQRDIGEPWMVLVVHIVGSTRSGIVTIDRSAFTLITPDGRRLPMMSQKEFREVYGRIQTRIRRAVESAPPFRAYRGTIRRCTRWFLATPGRGFGVDELYVSNFEECSGPMVFAVPNGIQPGRWRLIIDLEESRADIPFELEAEE